MRKIGPRIFRRRWGLVDYILLFLIVALAILVMSARAAGASWTAQNLTIKPGEWKRIDYANPENTKIELSLTNISCPSEILPYIVISPTTIPENSTTAVSIQLAYIPKTILSNIVPDIYSVNVSNLLIYIDLTEVGMGGATTIENLLVGISALENRISQLENSGVEERLSELEEYVATLEGFIARLENSGQEENISRLEELVAKLRLDAIGAREEAIRAREEAEGSKSLAVGAIAIALLISILLPILKTRIRLERKPEEVKVEPKQEGGVKPETAW